MTSHTNISRQFEIVANHDEIVCRCDTMTAALDALDAIGPVDDSPYGIVEILAPGQTTAGEMTDGCDIDADETVDVFGMSN